jgi:hypothetical protein
MGGRGCEARGPRLSRGGGCNTCLTGLGLGALAFWALGFGLWVVGLWALGSGQWVVRGAAGSTALALGLLAAGCWELGDEGLGLDIAIAIAVREIAAISISGPLGPAKGTANRVHRRAHPPT